MTAEAIPAWHTPRWWDLGVTGVSAVTAVLVAVTGTPRDALWTAVALAVFVGAWFAFGRRALDARPGWTVFAALTIAVCFVAAAIDPTSAIFQGLAFPLVWTLVPGLRSGIVANVVVATAVGAGYAISTGEPAQAAVVEVLSLALSIALGCWITQIERLSAQRRRLIEELTAAQAGLAALGRETGAGLERERLAREIHDTVAQSLTAVTMLAERARARHPDDEGLAVLEDTARSALGEARALVAATAGVPLTGGLAHAIDDLARRFGRETGLAVSASVTADVPRPLEVVLLRCAQEGLANVRKHAAAGAAWVDVEASAGAVRLTVRDDGRGIDPDRAGGFGLAGMRERLALVGGALEVRAVAPRGTELCVTVPTP